MEDMDYRSHYHKFVTLAIVIGALSLGPLVKTAGASECFHHYNPRSWDGKGTSIVMCPQTPNMRKCVIQRTDGRKLADMTKHGNRDFGRYIWTLYSTLGKNFPHAIDIVCESTSGNLFVFNIDDGRSWENGVCSTASCTQTSAEKPRVTIEAEDDEATETRGDTGIFRVMRTGSTASGLEVHFSMDGTALPNKDYTAFTSPVVIPPGSSHADLTLDPIDDSEVESDEIARVNLLPNERYKLGTPDSAKISVIDNDAPKTNKPPVSTGILFNDDR